MSLFIVPLKYSIQINDLFDSGVKKGTQYVYLAHESFKW